MKKMGWRKKRIGVNENTDWSLVKAQQDLLQDFSKLKFKISDFETEKQLLTFFSTNAIICC